MIPPESWQINCLLLFQMIHTASVSSTKVTPILMIKPENRLKYFNKKYSFSIEKSQADNFAKYRLFLGLTAYNLYIKIGVKNNYQMGFLHVFKFIGP